LQADELGAEAPICSLPLPLICAAPRLALVVSLPLLFETGAHRAMGLRVLVVLDQEAQVRELLLF